MTRLTILSLLFVILSTSFGFAQKITANTSVKDVFAMQAFDVSYSIEGSGGDFTPPDFAPMRVVAGPFTSNNITIINGKRSESKSFTYRLQCDKVGKYKIPAASFKTGTAILKSNTLDINIIPASKENSMQGNNLFLEMDLRDSIVYVGQQVLVDHDLFYGNIDLRGSAIVGDFPVDRFLVNVVKDGSRIERTQLLYKGKMQNKAKLSRLAIYPLRSGDISFPPVNFQISLQNPNAHQSRGFFSFNSYETKIVSTPEFTIKVKPLPTDGPKDFSGCVGFLNARASTKSTNWKVGEESFVELEVVGNGISEQVTAPVWKQEGFEIFEPKLLSEDKRIQDGEILFVKQFRYLVIPTKGGTKNLDIPFNYFDPKQGIFVERLTSVPSITIQGSDIVLEDATSKTIGSDDNISYIPWYNKLWVWGLLTLILGILAGVIYFVKNKPKALELTAEEAALNVAKRKLSLAKDLLESEDKSKYWETLENSLRIYLEEKLNIGTSDYSIAEIASLWKEKSMETRHFNKWKEMVDKINLARYAGQNISNMENLYKEALDWIVDIEVQ